MKKIISLIAAAALSAAAAGAAHAESKALTGYAVDNGIYVECDVDADIAVLTAYSDNAIVYSCHTSKETGGYFFAFPAEYNDERLRLYCVGDGIYEVELTEYDAVSSATVNETEPPAETVRSTSEPAPTRTPVPAVYERNLDALNAPAVVKSVSERLIDNETYYETTMLYQGTEIKTDIVDWVTIDSAPARYSDLKGQNASALKEGDVIHFTNNMHHEIRSIDLIYRADFDNYIESGGDYGAKYSKLTGSDNYSKFVFGAPVKTAKGYILLADVDGRTTEVDVSDKAFIYSVTKGRRAKECELCGTGAPAVPRVFVPNNAFDSNENVVSWTGIDITAYALARVVNGTATEVFVFEY